jgi:hypothetical protein
MILTALRRTHEHDDSTLRKAAESLSFRTAPGLGAKSESRSAQPRMDMEGTRCDGLPFSIRKVA